MIEETKTVEEESQQPFQLMDMYDEKEIMDAMSGKYLEGMVYEFRQKQGNTTRTVRGISYTGVKEIAQQFSKNSGGPIELDIVSENESAEFIRVIVKASHIQVGTRYGVAVQKKFFSNGTEDMYAWTKAYSKAQRNAIRQIIPEHAIKVFIDDFLDNKKQARNVGREPEEREQAESKRRAPSPPKQEEPENPEVLIGKILVDYPSLNKDLIVDRANQILVKGDGMYKDLQTAIKVLHRRLNAGKEDALLVRADAANEEEDTGVSVPEPKEEPQEVSTETTEVTEEKYSGSTTKTTQTPAPEPPPQTPPPEPIAEPMDVPQPKASVWLSDAMEHRRKDDKGYWRGDDIGKLETDMMIQSFPQYIRDVLKEAKLGADSLMMAKYFDEIVIAPRAFLGDLWTQYRNALAKAGFDYCSAGKSSHFFLPPSEDDEE
jgi:hypothetical protein